MTKKIEGTIYKDTIFNILYSEKHYDKLMRSIDEKGMEFNKDILVPTNYKDMLYTDLHDKWDGLLDEVEEQIANQWSLGNKLYLLEFNGKDKFRVIGHLEIPNMNHIWHYDFFRYDGVRRDFNVSDIRDEELFVYVDLPEEGGK